jgi:hypothetical protein
MAVIIGLITVNGKEILEVNGVPSAGAGTPAPRASLAMYDNGAAGFLYVKTGTADTAWQQVDVPEANDWELFGNILSGGAPNTPNESFGSTNDYDVILKRNNSEIARLVTGSLLVGLNASLGGRLQVGAAALGDEILKQSSPNGGSGAVVTHVTRQYKVLTTDNVLTNIGLIAIPTDSVIYAKMTIGARQTGGILGAAGDGGVYVRETHARNVLGVCTIRKLQTSFTSEDSGTFDVSVDINTTNIRYRVQGDTSRNMSWVGHAEIMIITD